MYVAYSTTYPYMKVDNSGLSSEFKDVSGNFVVVAANGSDITYSSPMTQTNINITSTIQSSLPTATVNIAATTAEAVECSAQNGSFKVSRSSSF